MTLEDFEKSLVDSKKSKEKRDSHHRQKESRSHHKHHRHHRGEREDQHRSKRRRHSHDDPESRGRDYSKETKDEEIARNFPEDHGRGGAATLRRAEETHAVSSDQKTERDDWMKEPLALDVDFTQNGIKKSLEPTVSRSSRADFELKIHDNELNKHHLQELADGQELPQGLSDINSKHEVDYHFGDAGAQWRMTKLKSVYRRAEEGGRSVNDVAVEHYGDLRTFDDAREEQTELDRREMYGEGYVEKEKPSGELFEERRLAMGLERDHDPHDDDVDEDKGAETLPQEIEAETQSTGTTAMDQTSLNRLKARMLKAKVRGSSDVQKLEAEYEKAIANFANLKQSESVVLGVMESRMLAGSRKGEVKSVENKRGRERGLVEENEDMTIEDMVRQERRNRHQAGGDGQRFAERIAKDAKFDNDLDYLDENASKLAKRVQKSEVNLKNTAISDFQKMNRVLDKCPLCYHEDTNTPPVAPVLSLGTRVYLTLPTEPEISDGGACIIPVQHRGNLLECDDDEWEEIRVRSLSLLPLLNF